MPDYERFRILLEEERERKVALLPALRADIASANSARQGSNVDDEHDPEGSTIAFELSQEQRRAGRGGRGPGQDCRRHLWDLRSLRGSHRRGPAGGTAVDSILHPARIGRPQLMSSGPSQVAAAAEFIDRTLQNEGSWYRADDVEGRLGGQLASYGSSVGAVRGTIRDALRKYKDFDHDAVMQLASALWGQPRPGSKAVFERRLAAVVLLQSRTPLLLHSDLTRLEGFLRSAGTSELTQPLLADVVVPFLARLRGRDRQRAQVVLGRWEADPDSGLRRAAAFIQQQSAPEPRPQGDTHERSL